MHWAVEELQQIMPPPPQGGDIVDWDSVRTESGWALPADYRDFVAVYGLGAISDSIGISTPPFPGHPYEDHLLCNAEYPPRDGVLSWGADEAGDDFVWRCVGEPDEWTVVFRLRNRREQYEYEIGMAEFLLLLLQQKIHPPLGAQLAIDPPTFESWRDEARRLLDENADREGF
ncbi:hypothetical protein AB4305_22310 [Nocardia sp. 2YAB30]|uniref:hypothetical protein n=1 Tax=unclassified Nocardia TaxID=2637762 RepID=UPI003F949645